MQKILYILLFIPITLYANLFEIGNLDISGVYKIKSGYLKYHDEEENKAINSSFLIIKKIKNNHYGYYHITNYQGWSHFVSHYGGFIVQNSKVRPTQIDYYSKQKTQDKSSKINFIDEITLNFNSHSLNADTYRTYEKVDIVEFSKKEAKELAKAKQNYQDFYYKYTIKKLRTLILF